VEVEEGEPDIPDEDMIAWAKAKRERLRGAHLAPDYIPAAAGPPGLSLGRLRGAQRGGDDTSAVAAAAAVEESGSEEEVEEQVIAIYLVVEEVAVTSEAASPPAPPPTLSPAP
jgi:hypothetical protein